MYNYKKELPTNFYVEKEIVKGSSAKIYILNNSNNERIVRKISDVEGVNNNGKGKLKEKIK